MMAESHPMMAESDNSLEEIVAALKAVVSTLRRAEIPFLLAGSSAAWARGAPPPHNDLDLMLAPEDAERAVQALGDAGMRTERPPEEWLYKAWCGDILVDLIFGPSGLEMNEAVFARGQTIPVMAISTPVMAIEDVLATKLSALDEHSLNYTPLLGIARALREQIDWPALRARTGESAYAEAFFTLVRELGIAPAQEGTASSPGPSRVRVITGG